MNRSDVKTIERTFGLASARMDAFSISFYRHLFSSSPDLRSLFPEDMGSQRRKLVQSLAMMVHRLEDTAALVPMLRNLGARHTSYGARPEHYRLVKAALVAAFAEILGEAFDHRAREAWSKMFDWVEEQMLSGVPETSPSSIL
jgi:hemoglobin-like flavoprotein